MERQLREFGDRCRAESVEVHKTLTSRTADIVALDNRIDHRRIETKKNTSDIDFLRTRLEKLEETMEVQQRAAEDREERVTALEALVVELEKGQCKCGPPAEKVPEPVT